mmetsp:Transcript_26328/g.36707  ORF Transcript_26328/g.36707 Transcript_26328/m.36707 type:complete len:130 (+) Transcript_26328:37-426(+)
MLCSIKHHISYSVASKTKVEYFSWISPECLEYESNCFSMNIFVMKMLVAYRNLDRSLACFLANIYNGTGEFRKRDALSRHRSQSCFLTTMTGQIALWTKKSDTDPTRARPTAPAPLLDTTKQAGLCFAT